MRKTVINVVIIVLVGAALAAALLVFQDHRKDEMGRSMLREFKDDLARVSMEAPARAYVDGLADVFHDEAYSGSFGADAPAIGGVADVTGYQRALLSSMLAQAARDGRADVVKLLEGYRDTVATLDLREDGGGG